MVFTSNSTFSGGLAVDSTSVYAGFKTGVVKVPKIGSASTVIAAGEPTSLALLGSSLWWTQVGGTVHVTTTSGDALCSSSGTGAFGMTTDGTSVYWIARSSTNGSNYDIIYATSCNNVYRKLIEAAILATTSDGINIYWTPPTGVVFKTPKGGGQRTSVVPYQELQKLGSGGGASIVVDGTSVFWQYHDKILKAPK